MWSEGRNSGGSDARLRSEIAAGARDRVCLCVCLALCVGRWRPIEPWPVHAATRIESILNTRQAINTENTGNRYRTARAVNNIRPIHTTGLSSCPLHSIGTPPHGLPHPVRSARRRFGCLPPPLPSLHLYLHLSPLPLHLPRPTPRLRPRDLRLPRLLPHQLYRQCPGLRSRT